MSDRKAKRSVAKNRTQKSATKKRVERVERTSREGLEMLIEDVRALFGNIRMVAEALDSVDVHNATIRSLCLKKGLFSKEEYDAELELIKEEKAKIEETRRAAVEAARELAKQEHEASREGMEGYDEDAFIFGG